LLEEKKKLLDRNTLFAIRADQRGKDKLQRYKNICFFFSVLSGIILLLVFYLLSDQSDIYRISVKGNHYLNKQQIIEESGLDNDHKFLLTFPYSVEQKLKKNLLIRDCKVSLLDHRLVEIEIEEKKLIAYGIEDNQTLLYLETGESYPLNSDEMYLILKVPFIEGFSQDDIILIGKNLSECDYQTIDEISEIHFYPDLKYQNIELIMKDGNYIFTSSFGLNLLNHYYDIRSSHKSEKNECYYFEDISGNAYISACPWQIEASSEEE